MNESTGSPPLLVTLYSSAMHILDSTLKNCVCNCLSISYQLIIEFLDNVAHQVKKAHVNELGNNLSLK